MNALSQIQQFLGGGQRQEDQRLIGFLQAGSQNPLDPDQLRLDFDAAGALVESDIYDYERLTPGNEIAGPAVIHTPITTIVLQDKQTGHLDEYRNIVIQFN